MHNESLGRVNCFNESFLTQLEQKEQFCGNFFSVNSLMVQCNITMTNNLNLEITNIYQCMLFSSIKERKNKHLSEKLVLIYASSRN